MPAHQTNSFDKKAAFKAVFKWVIGISIVGGGLYGITSCTQRDAQQAKLVTSTSDIFNGFSYELEDNNVVKVSSELESESDSVGYEIAFDSNLVKVKYPGGFLEDPLYGLFSFDTLGQPRLIEEARDKTCALPPKTENLISFQQKHCGPK